MESVLNRLRRGLLALKEIAQQEKHKEKDDEEEIKVDGAVYVFDENFLCLYFPPASEKSHARTPAVEFGQVPQILDWENGDKDTLRKSCSDFFCKSYEIVDYPTKQNSPKKGIAHKLAKVYRHCCADWQPPEGWANENVKEVIVGRQEKIMQSIIDRYKITDIRYLRLKRAVECNTFETVDRWLHKSRNNRVIFISSGPFSGLRALAFFLDFCRFYSRNTEDSEKVILFLVNFPMSVLPLSWHQDLEKFGVTKKLIWVVVFKTTSSREVHERAELNHPFTKFENWLRFQYSPRSSSPTIEKVDNFNETDPLFTTSVESEMEGSWMARLLETLEERKAVVTKETDVSENKEYTITVVIWGRTGAGKSSLKKYLIKAMSDSDPQVSQVRGGDSGTIEATEYLITHSFCNKVLKIRLIDHPGFGTLDSSDDFKVLKRNIIYYRATLLFYLFVKPRVLKSEVMMLKELGTMIPILPLVAQADTMTLNELCAFLKTIVRKTTGIKFITQEERFAITLPLLAGFQKPHPHIFPILGCPRRQYPWGERDCNVVACSDNFYFDNWRLVCYLEEPKIIEQLHIKALELKKIYDEKALWSWLKLGSLVLVLLCVTMFVALKFWGFILLKLSPHFE